MRKLFDEFGLLIITFFVSVIIIALFFDLVLSKPINNVKSLLSYKEEIYENFD